MTFLPNLKFYSKLTPMKKFWSGLMVVVMIATAGYFTWTIRGVQATVENYGAGTTNWTAPAGVYSVSVELWGGGGTGGYATGTGARAGGGAGGQYAIKQVTVVPGNTYAIVVAGASTAGNAVVPGNNSTFASTTVVAKGGAGGATSSGTTSIGGAGATTSGVGDTVYAGGSGGNGTASGSSGGGGGGAGSTGTGNSGSAGTAGIAKSANGGAGGTGVTTDAAVNPGNNYGGGGSGGLATGSPNRQGANGAAGYSQLTYTAVTTTLSDGTDPGNSTIAPGASATMAGAFNFQASAAGNYPVSAVVVGLGTGVATGISLVEITNDAGTTVYGSTSNPGTDTPTVTLSTNTLNVTNSLVQYKIRITPKTHANMAAPAGATYTVTAKINSWTDANVQAGTDTAGTTLTIDNSSPTSVTSTSGTPGNTTVALNWTTSASTDISRSVVLRWTATASGSEVPAEGTDYSVGNAISTATVVCVRTGESASTAVSDTDGGGGNCSASALTNGTAYSYEIFQKDTNGNYDTGVAVNNQVPFVAVVVTLSDGTDSSNSTLAPSAGATMADAFNLQISTGSDTISSLVVGLGSGASTGISLVEIVSDAGSTVYGSTAPGSDTPSITLSTNTLTVTTSLVQYKIRITPKTHANMAPPSGATYTVTAQVNSITPATASSTGSDTAGTTITIDNTSPSGATSTSQKIGDASVGLNWTTSASSDISRSVVLRWTAATAGSEVPVEGTDYSVGNTITTATVVCVRTGESVSRAVSEIDGGGGNGGNCSTTTLTYGTAYSYKIFQKDTNGNYDTGVAVNNQTSTRSYNDYGASIQGTISFQGGTNFKVARPPCGGIPTVTFTYNGGSVTYGTVNGDDGNCWMDRNLGATQVATSSTDYLAYGDLFQWGRAPDGHQLITCTNATTCTAVNGSTATNADIPGNNLFITETVSPYDWRVTQDGTLWANSSSTNNPCPASWHVPLQTEWATWVTSASVTNSATAYSSTLKLPLAGYRDDSTAGLYGQGSNGSYWSSSPNGTDAYYLSFDSGVEGPAFSYDRANGFSVRCVHD